MTEINLNYVHSERIGYGRLGVKLAEALAAKGVTVYDHLPAPGEATPEDRTAGLAEHVCWVSTPPHAKGWWGTQRPSIFTMWEATRLPETFRENLDEFETVLVPSDQNVELFSRWHPNVRRVLLGVDPAEWHYVERTPPGRFFDFLIGGSGARKGVDLAWRAFLAAFPELRNDGRPIPRLIMKSPRGRKGAGEPPMDERIVMVEGKLSPEDERALYASAHCYVQPSRGEGFGLQPLQAIAQGLPTILTDAHGHESFAHLGIGIEAAMKASDYFIFGDAGDWWEPDFDQLVEQMRAVYENYDWAAELGRLGAEEVAERFTWANVADQFIDALDLTAAGPFQPTDDWRKPTGKLYRVRSKRPGTFTCDVGTTRYAFTQGVDVWVPADVKRNLAESDVLDQDCITEDDAGLSPEQVERLTDPAGAGYCDHCGQRFGTGKTQSDDIFEELTDDPALTADPVLTAWHAGA